MEKAADALPIEQVAKRWIVASDPDEAVEKVGQYVTWGLNHLVFHAPGHDQRRFLELFQKDLEPRLRRLGLTRHIEIDADTMVRVLVTGPRCARGRRRRRWAGGPLRADPQ